MSNLVEFWTGDLDFLFNDEDPQATIESRSRQRDEPESDDEAAPESVDELHKAFEYEGGFSATIATVNHLAISVRLKIGTKRETQDQRVDPQLVDLDASLSPAILKLPASRPLKLTVKIIGARAQSGEDESNRKLGDVPLSVLPPTTPDVILLDVDRKGASAPSISLGY